MRLIRFGTALVLAAWIAPASAAQLDYTISGSIGGDMIFGQGVTNSLDPQEQAFSIVISGSNAILDGYTGTYVPAHVDNNVSPYAYIWINEAPGALYSPPQPGDLPGFVVYNLDYDGIIGTGVAPGTYVYHFYIADFTDQVDAIFNSISNDFGDSPLLQMTFAPAAASSVPEPGSIVLLALGLAGMAAFRRAGPFRAGSQNP